MFDSISKRDYERERELRIKAEADAAHWREQVAELREDLKAERARYTDLLDRLQPKPEKMPPFVGGGLARLSSEELRRLPAVGKRGVRERNTWVQEAVTREEQEKGAQVRQERREELSDEELAELDAVITT